MYDHLPGGEILAEGLRDLQAGVPSVAALLVTIATPRLARCGIRVPPPTASTSKLPEHQLYAHLVAAHGSEAYRHYRSLLRRLVSLESAVENLAAGR